MNAGADIVELHTGAYAHAHQDGDAKAFAAELARLQTGAKLADAAGLEVHAGHGLCFDTVAPISAISQVVELNIGHFLIGEAIFTGLEGAIEKMRRRMLEARRGQGASA
jgi:pyridoxine 5-phosphate synthase